MIICGKQRCRNIADNHLPEKGREGIGRLQRSAPPCCGKGMCHYYATRRQPEKYVKD